ncbi:hypothetical protein ACFRJ9_00765 [Paenarthrobacter sp. NPDC056912]|uniref:hypothetical protein n=1 Tax=Paenarthrobacter sp. NPDC056912 TaxID=3345965 RepID=UPI003672BC30
MAKVPDEPGLSGPRRNEPEYEVIGGGMIDDLPRAHGGLNNSATRPSPVRSPFKAAAAAAWQDTRISFSSWRFWLACALGVVIAGGLAAAVAGWGQANGWFESSVPSAIYLVMAAWLAIAAAVLGTVWGFRHSRGSIAALLLAGAIRGAAFAVISGVVLLVVGASVGGPLAVAGAAVVVVVLESALFGLIGAGSRACFAGAAPGTALAAVLVAFLCIGNVALTLMLLPGTTGMDQASVPVNVQRDDSGRITAYECVGDLRPVEVAHTERAAWLAASNPALLLGSVAADLVPRDNDVAWVLSGLQWAADGPAREVPCLGGESSDGLAPTVPVALTGLAVQVVVAALVAVPGRWLTSRRATS